MRRRRSACILAGASPAVQLHWLVAPASQFLTVLVLFPDYGSVAINVRRENKMQPLAALIVADYIADRQREAAAARRVAAARRAARVRSVTSPRPAWRRAAAGSARRLSGVLHALAIRLDPAGVPGGLRRAE
jgi:hypothetical protein